MIDKLNGISYQDKAAIINQALPYVQRYAGKVVVIKYGGNAMINQELKDSVMDDITLLSLIGMKVVVVHGGGPDISSTLKAMQIESKFVSGLRYTDSETAKIVQMVLAGKVNKDLVYQLQLTGGKAIGICGLDGGLLTAKKVESDTDLGFVGEITNVNVEMLHQLMDTGYVPVIAAVAGDDKGNIYNVNADTGAAAIAGALQAESFALMTDVEGVLTDINDPSSLLSHISVSEVPTLTTKGVISGGMIPKINGCVQAIRQGVSRAFIIDGRVPHSLLIEFLTDKGIGTMITHYREVIE